MTTPPRSVGARPPGYTMGQSSVIRAPITLAELDAIKRAMGWTQKDDAALRQAAPILEPRVDELLDVWYGFMASTPELIASFSSPTTGAPDEAYLERVRARIGQWVRDTLAARHDQAWLDYQFEIGRRHHRTGKNRTDHADASDIVPMRYLFALAIPMTETVRPFLEDKAPPADVERMLAAWRRAVLLQAILWSHPYVRPGDY